MKKDEDTLLDRNPQKAEVEDGNEKLHPSRKNDGQAKLSTGTLVLTTRSEQTDQLEDQGKDGKTTSMNS